MVNRLRSICAAAVCCLAAVAGGCSGGPERIHFDKALPGCPAFVPVLAAQGMPAPQAQASVVPSRASSGFDCSFSAAAGSHPPAIAVATILVSRPAYKSDEKDPAKRYGDVFVANHDCAGSGADNPALPSGSSCYTAKSPHDAFIAVSSIARQAGIRVTLQWSDPDTTGDRLRADALDKANAIVRSVIAAL